MLVIIVTILLMYCSSASVIVLCGYYIMIILRWQILVLYESVPVVNVEGVVKYVSSLQQPDGSFIGDNWGTYMREGQLKCVCVCLRDS